MTSSRTKYVVGYGMVVATMLITTFLLRGWIRGTAVPAYVEHFYKAGVSKQFDRDFAGVEPRLNELGFTFNDQTLWKDECDTGTAVSYEFIAETVGCRTSKLNDDRSFTNEFVSNWRQKSIPFEQFLLADGWQKQWNKNQPIDEIYNNPANPVGIGVNYSKKHGKTSCNLGVNYNASSEDPNKTWARISCGRSIKFFGGY